MPSVDAPVCEEFELDSDNLSCDRAHEPRIPAIPPADAFTFIASFRSEDEAKAYLSRMNKCRYHRLNNSASTYTSHVYVYCVTHIDCQHVARVTTVTSTTVEGDASQLLYNLLVSGNHSTVKSQRSLTVFMGVFAVKWMHFLWDVVLVHVWIF